MSVTRTAASRSAFHFCPICGSTTSWHWLPERAGSNVFWEGDRNPNTYRITVGSFADPNFPAANLLGVGRVDASLARSGDGDRVLPAGSASDPVDAAPCLRRRFSDLPEEHFIRLEPDSGCSADLLHLEDARQSDGVPEGKYR
jgi:hypothetical protein